MFITAWNLGSRCYYLSDISSNSCVVFETTSNSKKFVLKNSRQNRFFSFPSQNWLMFAGSQQLFCRLNVKVEIEELFQPFLPFLAFYDPNLRFKNHWLKRQTRNEYLSLLTSTYFNAFHKYTRHACWANINKLISTKKKNI